MDRQRCRGLSGVWYHVGLGVLLPYKPWDFAQHSKRRGLQVCGRKCEGRGKSVRNLQRTRGEKEANKIKAATGMTVENLRRFKEAMIRPTQQLPERLRLRRYGSVRTYFA